LAEPLLDEDRRGGYSLENLSRWYLKEGKEEGKLKQAADAYGIDAKSDLWRLHSKHVGPYAEIDAQLPIHIFAQQSVRLRQQNLLEIFELESSLIPVVLDMRFLGVRVDIERAYDLSKKMLFDETELLQGIKTIAGYDFNPWSSKSISSAFDKLDIDYPLTEKGNPSITRAWLDNHPSIICNLLVRYRTTSKIRRDFVQGVILDQNIDGRIHAQFHQLRKDLYGTRSGRFSSSHPNLQQIPSRDGQYGPLIRSLFLPDKGCKWGKFDYSQQEPRLTVHYGELCGLNGSTNAGDIYRKDPNADYHKIIADMTGLPRRDAKTINLGLAYGMGKIRLASELNSTVTKAEEMLEKYHELVPFIRQLANKCSDKSMNLGEIVTICGRKRRLDNRSHHKALNSLIQGSAADMTKKAMFECHKEGWVPHIQVHDELCFSLNNPKNEAPRIKEIMETVVKLSVPVVVDCDIGNNWACKESE
jgi:DNA polymerase I-like protein with 3'-5' exonuclease and polymerase domains